MSLSELKHRPLKGIYEMSWLGCHRDHLRGRSGAESAGSRYEDANSPRFPWRYTGGRSKRRPYGEKRDGLEGNQHSEMSSCVLLRPPCHTARSGNGKLNFS